MAKTSKKKENQELLKGLYENMELEELKSEVIKNLKRIKITEEELKDFSTSSKETVKDLKDRIDALIYWVGVKETEEARKELEEAAAKALEPEED